MNQKDALTIEGVFDSIRGLSWVLAGVAVVNQ